MDAIQLPSGITLPTAFGSPVPLQPGQVIQALVLALIESDVFRLQLPQNVVDVRSDVPLTPGSTITLAAKGAGTNAKLVIYADVPAAPAAARQGDVAPSLAGRRPLGEAVIIARAPNAQTRISAEPAVARDAPSISPARVVAPQPEAPVRVVTSAQAVGEAVRVAASRQSGLAPLFADVEQVQAASALPAPVRAAANELLALRVPLDEQLTASDVKQAFVRSGLLFEPRLAASRAAPAPDLPASPSASPPGGDLKATLLVFRQVLKVWAASEPVPGRVAPPIPAATTAPQPPPEAVARSVPLPAPLAAPLAVPLPQPDAASIKHLASALAGAPGEMLPDRAPLSPEEAATLAKSVGTALLARDAPSARPATPIANGGPPPPYRGAPLAAQAPALASIAPDAAPREAAERLIAQTDGALARQTLLQVASLPDQADLSTPRTEASQRWTFEVPFATPQGTGIAQFEVSRDGRAANTETQPRVWRARFSLDVDPMGPVHALIALAGERASVTLWAERVSTASRLNENSAMLSEALRAAALEPADFQLRVGAPPAARQAAPGKFMDRAS